MSLKNALPAAALAAAVLTPAPAQAQNPASEEITALRAQIEALQAQVDALEKRIQKGEASGSSPSAPATEMAAAKHAGPEIKFKGAPEISDDKGWSFKPRGRLLFDVASVNAPGSISDRGLGFSNELRRARLGVEGTMPGNFGYKFEIDFATGEAELTDAHLTYKTGGLTFTVGQHNNFQGLEELSSSNDTSFMERAAFTDAFGFERRAGISAQYHAGALLAQAGLFSDNVADLSNDENNSRGGDIRLVYAPKLGSTQLHLGASGHWRELGDAFSGVSYRQRPLVHTTDTRFISTGSIPASSEAGYGLEAAVISGRFHAAGEAYWQRVSRSLATDPTFFGGSIEAGLFLTDDSREYKGGIFKGIKVRNPVGSGGFGALQFNVRYDRLDLDSAGITGGTQNGYMASLIWTPIDYVRFMLNYARIEYDNAAVPAGTSRNYGVDVFGARSQIVF
ncbi:MAG: OprO/OprP family phosphate-selective porin [Sphingobium sp.]